MRILQSGQYKVIFLFIIISLFCFQISVCAKDQTKMFFTFNTADKEPYSTQDNYGIYDRIILNVCQLSGIDFKINHLPSARSIENVDIGLDDGEYARIKGLSENYPNIRIVDEKLIDFAFTAFAKDEEMIVDGWRSLKSYNVAFIKGWKIYEMNVTDAQSIQVSSSEEELFRLLQHGRVDVILYERQRGLDYIHRKNLQGIFPIERPLSVRGMYLYVNKRHESLIPKLEEALRILKRTGIHEDIINSFNR